MKKESIYVFDAYGTLFDVDSACRNLSIKLGKNTIWGYGKNKKSAEQCVSKKALEIINK